MSDTPAAPLSRTISTWSAQQWITELRKKVDGDGTSDLVDTPPPGPDAT